MGGGMVSVPGLITSLVWIFFKANLNYLNVIVLKSTICFAFYCKDDNIFLVILVANKQSCKSNNYNDALYAPKRLNKVWMISYNSTLNMIHYYQNNWLFALITWFLSLEYPSAISDDRRILALGLLEIWFMIR